MTREMIEKIKKDAAEFKRHTDTRVARFAEMVELLIDETEEEKHDAA